MLDFSYQCYTEDSDDFILTEKRTAWKKYFCTCVSFRTLLISLVFRMENKVCAVVQKEHEMKVATAI